jgi:hypothetical protein
MMSRPQLRHSSVDNSLMVISWRSRDTIHEPETDEGVVFLLFCFLSSEKTASDPENHFPFYVDFAGECFVRAPSKYSRLRPPHAWKQKRKPSRL